jgi:tRNA U34 2-thiouridine synthase MnmA/TrmU
MRFQEGDKLAVSKDHAGLSGGVDGSNAAHRSSSPVVALIIMALDRQVCSCCAPLQYADAPKAYLLVGLRFGTVPKAALE